MIKNEVHYIWSNTITFVLFKIVYTSLVHYFTVVIYNTFTNLFYFYDSKFYSGVKKKIKTAIL